jgi:hypothetical protein
MSKRANPNPARLALLLWLLLAFFYFFISYDYIRISMADKNFADYMRSVVQIAATDHRSPKEIRALLLVKSEQFGLPISPEQISVSGEGQTLNIAVNYAADIEIPVFDVNIYQKVFQHKVSYASPR